MLLSELRKPLYVINNGERILLTEDTINKTCKWYADNAQSCIDEVLSGKVTVNDIESYTEGKIKTKADYLARNFELGLWFYQKALHIQTGESVAILN